MLPSQQSTTTPLACQLDVSALDEYLHSLLLTKFIASLDPLLKYVSDDENDLRRILRILLSSLLPAMTIWSSQAQTPATKALGLRAAVTSSKSNVLVAKWKYIFFASILPLLYHVLQGHILKIQQARGEEEIAGESEGEEVRERIAQRNIARERQYALAQGVLRAVKLGLPLCKLGLLLSMLWIPKGRNYSPRLSMVLAGLGFLTSSSNTSSSNSEATDQSWPPRIYVLYAHRRWLYEETMQTVKIVFAPLLASLQEARRFVEVGLEQLVRGLTSMWMSSTSRSLPCASLEAPCAICGKFPISVPYQGDVCNHQFCYTCLWHASNRNRNRSQTAAGPLQFGTGYPCPTCHRRIRSSRPVSFDRYSSKAITDQDETVTPSSDSRVHG